MALSCIAISDSEWVFSRGELLKSASPTSSRDALSELNSTGLYLPDYWGADPKPWRVSTEETPLYRGDRQAVTRFLGLDGVYLDLSALQNMEPELGPFLSLVREVQKHLGPEKELKKTVPAAVARTWLEGWETEDLTLSLLQRAFDCWTGRGFIYAYCDENEGFVGVTPEVLFRIDSDREVRTMALAGTQAQVGKNDEVNFDSKELDEHEWVVKDLVRQLRSMGEVDLGPLGCIEVPGRLLHLKTNIFMRSFEPVDFEALVRRLHPTPALGVYPRCAAGTATLKRIEEVYGPRGRFGAPVGVRLPDGTGVCYVGIRGFRYRRSNSGKGLQVELWAGCGVTAESVAQKEAQEVLSKMEGTKALFGLGAPS